MRATAAISAAPASALSRAALNTAQQPFIRPHQQRRLSSSKPSTPPADNKKKRVGEEKLDPRELQRAGSRAARQTKAADVSAAADVPAAAFNLPYVRPTDHLHEDGMFDLYIYIYIHTCVRRGARADVTWLDPWQR